jgi:hypothetical protein
MDSTIINPTLTLETCIELFKIPINCYVGKKVHKKLFYDNAKLSSADKKAFQEHLDIVTWMYALKQENTSFKAYVDGEREYCEISILLILLKQSGNAERIINLIHRAIPYPLLLICGYQDAVMFSIATKRFSLVEKGIIIVEEELNSGWISLVTLGKDELFFIKSLAVDSKMYITFLDLYLGWEASLIALACSRHTGQFKINDFNTKARKEVLEQCFALQDEISCLRSSIKKETQINKKVEINARINALKQLYMEYIKKI